MNTCYKQVQNQGKMLKVSNEDELKVRYWHDNGIEGTERFIVEDVDVDVIIWF